MGTIVVTVAGLSLLAVGVTVGVILLRRPADSGDIGDPPGGAFGPLTWIRADDLVVEDELKRGTEPTWVRFRPIRDRWDESDIDEHWIDPREIGIDVLAEEIEQSILRLMEDVP